MSSRNSWSLAPSSRARADDVAALLLGGAKRLEARAQLLALRLVLDAQRHADVAVVRQVDELVARERNRRGEPRALGADGVLVDLHHDRLPLVQDALDRLAAAVGAVRRLDVGDVQEGGALEPDVDEGALHAGEHAHDAPEVHVADEAAGVVALDEKILEHAAREDADAGFARVAVDENLFHCCAV
jgi:hypothetical protein